MLDILKTWLALCRACVIVLIDLDIELESIPAMCSTDEIRTNKDWYCSIFLSFCTDEFLLNPPSCVATTH